jgi:hypothetical protein
MKDTIKNNKISLDYETHYVSNNGKMTYCGKVIPKDYKDSGTIEIVTCDKCITLYI